MNTSQGAERRRPEFAALRRRWDEALLEVEDRERRARMRLVRWVMLILATLAVVVLSQYEQRYRGCERGKEDRAMNAQGWRTAEEARSRTAQDSRVSAGERKNAQDAADSYARVARALEARTGSRLDCAATILPWN